MVMYYRYLINIASKNILLVLAYNNQIIIIDKFLDRKKTNYELYKVLLN